jgi:hypothetical protein
MSNEFGDQSRLVRPQRAMIGIKRGLLLLWLGGCCIEESPATVTFSKKVQLDLEDTCRISDHESLSSTAVTALASYLGFLNRKDFTVSWCIAHYGSACLFDYDCNNPPDLAGRSRAPSSRCRRDAAMPASAAACRRRPIPTAFSSLASSSICSIAWSATLRPVRARRPCTGRSCITSRSGRGTGRSPTSTSTPIIFRRSASRIRRANIGSEMRTDGERPRQAPSPPNLPYAPA